MKCPLAQDALTDCYPGCAWYDHGTRRCAVVQLAGNVESIRCHLQEEARNRAIVEDMRDAVRRIARELGDQS